MEIQFFIFIFLTYLIGSLSPSYFLGKAIKGVDLRDYGSGNLGFTNAARVMGKYVGIVVFIGDVLKGYLPVTIFSLYVSDVTVSTLGSMMNVKLTFGLAAIIGHCLPFYLGFKGGKGVLTSLGAFLAIAPAPMGIAFMVGVSIILISGIVSIGSLCGATTFAIVATYFYFPEKEWLFLIITWLTAVFVFYTHRANIGRLMSGTEPKFYKKVKVKEEEQQVDTTSS